MKRYLLLMIITAMLSSACTKDSELPAQPALAYLMVYNGSPDYYGFNALMLINNTPHSGLTYNDNGGGLVGAFNFSKYSFIDTGLFRIGFGDTTGLSGKINKLTEALFRFEDEKHYTLYLHDSVGYFNITTTQDDVAPSPDSAKIRLVHIAPDAGKIFLRIDTMAINAVKNIGYGGISSYASVLPDTKPGVRIMYVDPATGEERTLIRKSFPLEAGKCYTLILRGYKKPEDGNVNKTINLSTITNF